MLTYITTLYRSIVIRRTARLVALFAVVLIIVTLYWMGSSFGRFSFGAGTRESPFVLLADAFLSGHLHLGVTPDPELLKLANPYDPSTRGSAPFLWDLSLYKGRYFVYWGPVPTLLMYIPWRLVTGSYPDEHLVIMILSLLTVAAITAVAIRGASALEIPRPRIIPFWVLYVAFAGPLPLQLGGGVYVVAALTAVLFQVIGIGLLIQAITNPRHLYRLALGAGIAQILAIGSRPTLGLLVIGAAFILSLGLWKRGLRAILTVGLTFALPIVVGGSLLLLYNWARFDSLFELGATYQIGRVDLSSSSLCSFSSGYSWELIRMQLWQHFSRPPRLISHFPYFYFENALPYTPRAPSGYIGNDAVTGLLPISPLLLIGTVGLACFSRYLNKASRIVCLGLLLTACATTIFLTSCRFAAARYGFEIYMPWLLCSLWGTWLLLEYSRGDIIRPLLKTTIFGLMLVSISIGALGTFDGHFHKNILPLAALKTLKARILPEKTPTSTSVKMPTPVH